MSTRIPLPHAGAARRAPSAPWRRFFPSFLSGWELGEHVTVLGPTGSGKTTLLVELAEAAPVCVFLASKRRDRLFTELVRRRGWKLVHSAAELRELPHVEDRAGREVLLKQWRHVVFWPRSGASIRATRTGMGAEMRRAFDWAYARGGLALAADETLYLSKELRLGPELETLWHEGRSSQVSLLAATQRPAWIPRSAYSAATYLFSFSTNDPADLKRLADIGGGLEPGQLEREIRLLPRYEFMFAAPRERPPILLRSRVQ